LNAIFKSINQEFDQKFPGGLFEALALVFFPAIIFYSILSMTALNIPNEDDYDTLLAFANQLHQTSSFPAKVSLFFASQHNEYKLFFEHGIVWIQLLLLGRINLLSLEVIGNTFVALLAAFVWIIFLPQQKNLSHRLALFLPVPWILFQLQYFQTLNWAMAGLQNLSVLFFSFVCLYLLFRRTPLSSGISLVSYTLAIASSGNGFVLLPIVFLVLIVERRYKFLLGWLATTTICVVAYAYHYNPVQSGVQANRGILTSLLHFNPIYAISFIGSASGIPFPKASFALGFTLSAFFAWMVFRGYIRKNPLVSCCVLFLLLTAIGVAGIRSDLGVTQSLSSRYTIYSALLSIFAWLIIVEEFLQFSRKSLLNNGFYLGITATAILFCLSMDAIGFVIVRQRNHELIQGITAYEHPRSANDIGGPLSAKAEAALPGFNQHARSILQQSIRLGIYRPPAY
jgi:hypothetical protein